MRDPRIDPIVGDVVERHGVVRTVTELWHADRFGISGTFSVCFRHQKRGREDEETAGALSLTIWRERTEGATILKRGDEPHTVTQAQRDALREAIWAIINERTRYWVDREREIQDVVLAMSLDIQQENNDG